MRIESILYRKGSDVATIPPAAVVRHAVQLFALHQIGALVVSEDGRHIVGVVSERDIAHALADHAEAALDLTVAEIMTSEVHTCGRNDTVDGLMATMTERRVRHVPVVDDDETLVGIVSIGDVVKHRLDELEAEARTLHDYIQLGR